MFAKIIVAVSATVLVASTTTGVRAQSDDQWFIRGDFQGLLGQYSASEQRDTLQNLGFFLRADYLETAGVTVGYNRTMLGFDDSSQDIEQDNVFLSGRIHLTPDWAPGKITLRLDGHAISNDDATNETDDVKVIAPQISYLNFAKTFYADIGYASSSYGDSTLTSEALDVDQFTPTLGFGFNEQRDWLQLRAYLINPSSSLRAQGTSDTTALEIKWTHWPVRGLFQLNNIRASALIGERIFAVDPDAAAVFNLADLQTGAVSVGGEWVPSENNRILLLLGVEQYENKAIADDYTSGFAYINFTHEWK